MQLLNDYNLSNIEMKNKVETIEKEMKEIRGYYLEVKKILNSSSNAVDDKNKSITDDNNKSSSLSSQQTITSVIPPNTLLNKN